MVWYNLKIGSEMAKFTPLKPKEKNMPYCDKEGKELERFTKVKGQYSYRYSDTQEEFEGNVYKKFNDKAINKLKKTKEINSYKIVSKVEAFDLRTEHYYLMELDNMSEIKAKINSDKALTFVYSNGNGYKAYRGYIYKYADKYLMTLGREFITSMVGNITTISEQSKAKIEAMKEEVSSVSAEALL